MKVTYINNKFKNLKQYRVILNNSQAITTTAITKKQAAKQVCDYLLIPESFINKVESIFIMSKLKIGIKK